MKKWFEAHFASIKYFKKLAGYFTLKI